MLPATSTTEPNSPTARAKLIAAPDRMAGTRLGSTMRRRIIACEAPSDAAACSISRSSSSTTGCTERTTKGSVTNSSARRIAQRVPMTFTPTGDAGPARASRMMPTTTVGSAKGRSMSALTTPLPRKRSRASTHAVMVPRTALNADTPSEIHSVSTRADTGIRTMTLSHSVEMPSPSMPLPPADARRATRRAGRASLLGSGDSRVLLDGGDLALVGVEEVVVELAPAAEVLDGEQAARGRELLGVRREHVLVDGPVAPLGELLLRGLGQRVLHERLRRGGLLGLRQHGDRVLDLDRAVGDHVVDVLALLLRGQGLVLVADEHVAVARDEVLQRLATGLVLDLHVLGDELVQV